MKEPVECVGRRPERRPERRPKYGGRVAPVLDLTDGERQVLQEIVRQRTAPQQLVLRAKIILAAGEGLPNCEIRSKLGLSRDIVSLWRRRWARTDTQQATIPAGHQADEARDQTQEPRGVAERLADEPRPGAPPRISAEQYCKIMAVACEDPKQSGRPITQWTAGEIADEVIKRGIVETISPRQVGRFFKRCGSKTASYPVLAGPGTRRTARSKN